MARPLEGWPVVFDQHRKNLVGKCWLWKLNLALWLFHKGANLPKRLFN
jgi:hypothetical protein